MIPRRPIGSLPRRELLLAVLVVALAVLVWVEIFVWRSLMAWRLTAGPPG